MSVVSARMDHGLNEYFGVRLISLTHTHFYTEYWKEARHISILSGSDVNGAGELIDRGLWDQPLLDPDTAVSGSIYLPVGPWIHCKLFSIVYSRHWLSIGSLYPRARSSLTRNRYSDATSVPKYT